MLERAAGLDFGTINIGFSPMDVFTSAISLAQPFLPFLLLGLSFVIAPWLFGIVINAIKKGKGGKTA